MAFTAMLLWEPHLALCKVHPHHAGDEVRTTYINCLRSPRSSVIKLYIVTLKERIDDFFIFN